MDEKQHAYRTDDPVALAAYRTARASRAEFARRLRADTEALGGNDGACSSRGAFGGPETIVGLRSDGSATVPAGWRLADDVLVPASRGKGSVEAQRWLAEHQPAPEIDVRYALKPHGLAYQSRIYIGKGDYLVYLPTLFEHDGKLWACYRGEPDGDFPDDPPDLTWPECPLEEYEAAKEAVMRAPANQPADRTLRSIS